MKMCLCNLFLLFVLWLNYSNGPKAYNKQRSFHISLIAFSITSKPPFCPLIYPPCLVCYVSRACCTLKQTISIGTLWLQWLFHDPLCYTFRCISTSSFSPRDQYLGYYMTVWCKLTSIRNMWSALFLVGKLQCSISYNTKQANCCRTLSLLKLMGQRWDRV